MARIFNQSTIEALKAFLDNPDLQIADAHKNLQPKSSYKEFYNLIFRLAENGLLDKVKENGKLKIRATKEAKKLVSRLRPQKDGVWKIVIFDIPEKQKFVRGILRAKLKSLGFKKWQNSIWISPFALDPEIENELTELGNKFFIRLIKTSDINHIKDLHQLFE